MTLHPRFEKAVQSVMADAAAGGDRDLADLLLAYEELSSGVSAYFIGLGKKGEHDRVVRVTRAIKKLTEGEQ